MPQENTAFEEIRRQLEAEVHRAFEEAIKPVGALPDKWPTLWETLSNVLVLLCNAAAAVDAGEDGSARPAPRRAKPTFIWAGALKDLRARYTSVDLQHAIAKWRVGEE